MQIQKTLVAILILFTALTFTACGDDGGGDKAVVMDPSLLPSTIIFTDAAPVKQLGTGDYTNAVTGGNGTGAITYSSSTISTATVNSTTGVVTIIGAGTTIITAVKAATLTHSTVTATYTLTVTALPPSTIVFTDTDPSKQIDSGSYTNAVTGGNGTGTITYTSSNPEAATVHASTGVVSLVAAGTTVITATKSASGSYDIGINTYTLTVTKILSTIIFTDGNVTKLFGIAGYINVVSGIGSGDITYSSATPETATINATTGELTLVAAGTTVISATKAETLMNAAVTNTYTLTVLGIGSDYEGGKIAYFFKSGDYGYISGESHGIIAAATNQSGTDGIAWCLPEFNSTRVDFTSNAIGAGLGNTEYIVGQNDPGRTGLTTYAAGLARAYRGGDKTDWVLPSKDELTELYNNRAAIGGFEIADYDRYWSSSEREIDGDYAYFYQFTGSTGSYWEVKNTTPRVRAVRYF